MRERATGIGGLFKILSSPETGTEVQLSIPITFALVDHSGEAGDPWHGRLP